MRPLGEVSSSATSVSRRQSPTGRDRTHSGPRARTRICKDQDRDASLAYERSSAAFSMVDFSFVFIAA